MKNKTTMKPKILSVAIIGLPFASCSSTHIISDEHPQRDQPTEKEQIEVYSDQKTERDYIIIGKLGSSVDDFSDAKGAVKQLKKEAAQIGVDAIIKVDLTKTSSTSGISGIAIKIKAS